MATLLLESLLRGCVRLDVPALGLGAVAFGNPNPGNPTAPTPMPTQGTDGPDADSAASGTLPGAGRSLRSSGIRVHAVAECRPYSARSV
jgi:hypothetical protein